MSCFAGLAHRVCGEPRGAGAQSVYSGYTLGPAPRAQLRPERRSAAAVQSLAVAEARAWTR